MDGMFPDWGIAATASSSNMSAGSELIDDIMTGSDTLLEEVNNIAVDFD